MRPCTTGCNWSLLAQPEQYHCTPQRQQHSTTVQASDFAAPALNAGLSSTGGLLLNNIDGSLGFYKSCNFIKSKCEQTVWPVLV